MIAYLPEIYPDELVYSWLCRYYVHSGCITHKMALREILLKRSNNPSKEFIGNLNPDFRAVINKMYSIGDLVLNHTMFPQYARFIPLDEKKKSLHHIGYDFCDVHHLFAVLPRNDADRFLKFCPLCAVEDRQKYGETYWHRKHQIRNLSICAKHQCRLINSSAEAKSEQDFTLSPAEFYVYDVKPEIITDSMQLSYMKYITDVFNAQIDFEKDTSVAAVLYKHMSKTKYMKSSGRSRYTKRLADDMKAFYEKIGLSDIASIYQVQRVILQERFDFNVVCQIAFYLGLSVEELTKPDVSATLIKREQESHYIKNKEPIDWASHDEETAPLLEQLAHDIYNGIASKHGRPERVSEKIIYRKLGLPGHRLDNLPKCRAVLSHYSEPYEENWARRIIWAYKDIRSKQSTPIYWTDIRKISGVKKHNIHKIIPYIYKHTDKKTAIAIIKILI